MGLFELIIVCIVLWLIFKGGKKSPSEKEIEALTRQVEFLQREFERILRELHSLKSGREFKERDPQTEAAKKASPVEPPWFILPPAKPQPPTPTERKEARAFESKFEAAKTADASKTAQPAVPADFQPHAEDLAASIAAAPSGATVEGPSPVVAMEPLKTPPAMALPKVSPPQEPAEPVDPAVPAEELSLEARVGAVWFNRIGLALLAIGVGLLARMIHPQLGPAGKVISAYAGAMGLFAAAWYFEKRLQIFSRPVMAGALALGFFVSFAAHFVPAMECIGLVPSLLWMGAGAASIWLLAERWKSQPTAGLAIALGYVAALAAASDGESFSLVIIIFLAVAAVILFLRHDWPPIKLFAVAASYGSHFAWIHLADAQASSAEQAFWVNYSFLSAYYFIFTVSDLIWWNRFHKGRASQRSPRDQVIARVTGPANLMAYLASAAVVFLGTKIYLNEIHWFLFAFAFAQLMIGLAHRALGNRDHVFYPALAVVLATVGLCSWFGGLTLSLILAVEALVLLVAAHRTRLWLFHGLAQAVLAANFIHFWYTNPVIDLQIASDPSTGNLIGALAIASVYFVKAYLEEIWYGRGDAREWESGAEGPFSRAVGQVFSEFYKPIAPTLPYVHATLGAVLITRICYVSSALPMIEISMPVAVLLFTLIGLAVRSMPLLLAAVVLQFNLALLFVSGRTILESGPDQDWAGISVCLIGWIAAFVMLIGSQFRLREKPTITAGIVFSHLIVALGLVMCGRAIFSLWHSASDSNGICEMWIVCALLLLAYQERSARLGALSGDSDAKPFCALVRAVIVMFSSLLLCFTTERYTGINPMLAVGLVLWATGLLGAGAWRRDGGLYVAFLMLLIASHAAHFMIYGDDAGKVETNAGMICAHIALTLGLAVVQESALRRGRGIEGVGGILWIPYALAVITFAHFVHLTTGFPWSLAALGAAGACFAAASLWRGLRTAFFSSMAMALLVAPYVFFAEIGNMPSRLQMEEVFWSALVYWVVMLAFDQLLAWLERNPHISISPDLRRAARHTAVILSTVILFLAASTSHAIGANHEWTTACWAGIAFVLMIAGFALKEAHYRRTALAALALCLGRVFLIDLRGLEGIYRVLAFLLLGACMVGIAWLYARFASQIKRWL